MSRTGPACDIHDGLSWHFEHTETPNKLLLQEYFQILESQKRDRRMDGWMEYWSDLLKDLIDSF